MDFSGTFCRTVSLGIVLVTFHSSYALAGDGKVTINLLPFGGPRQKAPVATFEIGSPLTQGQVSVSSLTMKTSAAGAPLTGLAIALPLVQVGGHTFSPSYGDQTLEENITVGALSGIKVKRPRLRGLSFTSAHASSAFTLTLGQLAGVTKGLPTPALPNVAALTGRLQPNDRVTVTPRFALPLGSSEASGGAQLHLGTGLQAQLGPSWQIVADLSAARTESRRWAPLAVVGGLGKWSRGSLEASLIKATPGHSLLGPVPAGQRDRVFVKGALSLPSATELTLTLSSVGPAAGKRGGKRSFTLRARSPHFGTVKVAHDVKTNANGGRQKLTMAWQPEAATLGPRVRLKWAALTQLTGAKPGTSLFRSKLSARILVATGLRLTTEIDHGLFGSSPSLFDLGSLRVACEADLFAGTALQMGYTHKPGSTLPLRQRVEGRLIRTVSF